MALHETLGVQFQKESVRFAVFSEHARKIELCLFSADERKEERFTMQKGADSVWSIALKSIKPGQKYGFRAYGEYDPSKGFYFNPHKLLIDPFAKEISKTIDNWEDPAFRGDNALDSAFVTPKSVVVLDDPQADLKKYPFLHLKRRTDWKRTVIYEAHVKGFSIQNHLIPESMRGKFTAFTHPAVIAYLKNLGVTHVELLPVTPTMAGPHLKKEMGLSDYWGYNPVNHFALDPRYGTREEFKQMVNSLHQAGIEVGLDVVYNHSGEFKAQEGSLISYKGLDSLNYYRMAADGSYLDTTGCGNSLNPNTEAFAAVIEASLRSFCRTLGVDGFRFDLAADCALDENNQFNPASRFMRIVQRIQDEEQVKISGEPWSALAGYYRGQLGNMMEWNDKHKEAVRRFYRGDMGVAPLLAEQITGTEGIKENDNETKYIRYVAVHDGFTAYDAVTHLTKNNWANNEENRDGNNEEYAIAEPQEELRFRRIKSMLACSIFSRGVPLICQGDEIGRTQVGNNNAYCQDNEISWQKWSSLTKEQKDLYLFVRKALILRKKYPALGDLAVLDASQTKRNCPGITWLRPDGKEMSPSDWQYPFAKTLAFTLNGGGRKEDFMIILSGYENHLAFRLPPAMNGKPWHVILDTAYTAAAKVRPAGYQYPVKPYSFVMMMSQYKLKKSSLFKGLNSGWNHLFEREMG